MKLNNLQDQYFKALKLAEHYHFGQIDIGGNDYIEHVKYVEDNVKEYLQLENITNLQDIYNIKTAALLHDIIEDCGLTEDKLLAEGISQKSVNIIKTLTHDKIVPYKDYIINISKNKFAKCIKLADLSHNMDVRRLKKIDNNAIRRLKKYFYSYKFLIGEINEETYKNEIEKVVYE